MNEGTQPKTYKYQLDAECFIKLFLASDEEFITLKKELQTKYFYQHIYMERLSSKQIETICSLQYIFDSELNKDRITFLYNTEIIGDIIIDDTQKEYCNSLCCFESKFNRIIFSNSILNNIETLHGLEINKGASLFFINSVTGNININNSAIGDLHIKDSRINGFDINNSFIGLFEIWENNKIDFLMMENSTVKYFDIRDSIIESIFLFSIIVQYFDFCFSKSGSIIIRIVKGLNNIKISHSKINFVEVSSVISSIDIRASNILLFQSTDCNIPEFHVSLTSKFEAYIAGGQINLIDFRKTTLSKDTVMSFSCTKIYAMLMEEFVMLGNLYFRQVERAKEPFKFMRSTKERPYSTDSRIHGIPQLQALFDIRNNVINNAGECYEDNCLKLKEIIRQPTIRVSQSSLGKTEFSDCQLNEFSFEYNNSKIIDCFISGGSFPGDKISNIIDSLFPRDSLSNNNITIIDPVNGKIITGLEECKQKSSFYNQFKKIFEAQGDIYNATISQAKWAEHQRKYLRIVRINEKFFMTGTVFQKVKKNIELIFDNISQDRISLWLNKISNNHGESWLRPLGWLLGSAFVFYILYLWSIGRCFTNNTFDYNLIGYFGEFLNPLHKYDFIPDTGKLGGLSSFIDFLSKLSTAFFLYKFLSAFRKHGKK